MSGAGGKGGTAPFGGAAGMGGAGTSSGGAGSGGKGGSAGASGGKGGTSGTGGASGGKGGTGGTPTNCRSQDPAPDSSGNIGTGEVCFDIAAPIAGWQVSNLSPRTLTVNGMAATPPALPPAMGGRYIFVFSAGQPEYTSWSYWR
jgi:hypothetical protein